MNNSTINIAEYSLLFDETREVLKDNKGKTISADVKKISEGEFSVLVNGRSYHIFLRIEPAISSAMVNNFIFPIEKETFRDKLAKKLYVGTDEQVHSAVVRAPMPGMITKTLKREGDTVNSGDGVLIVEAMKMENEIKSPRPGIISKIFVSEKQTVEKNDTLFTIE